MHHKNEKSQAQNNGSYRHYGIFLLQWWINWMSGGILSNTQILESTGMFLESMSFWDAKALPILTCWAAKLLPIICDKLEMASTRPFWVLLIFQWWHQKHSNYFLVTSAKSLDCISPTTWLESQILLMEATRTFVSDSMAFAKLAMAELLFFLLVLLELTSIGALLVDVNLLRNDLLNK